MHTSWTPRYTVAKLPFPRSLTITYGFTSASSTLNLSVRSDVELVVRLFEVGAVGVAGAAEGDIARTV